MSCHKLSNRRHKWETKTLKWAFQGTERILGSNHVFYGMKFPLSSMALFLAFQELEVQGNTATYVMTNQLRSLPSEKNGELQEERWLTKQNSDKNWLLEHTLLADRHQNTCKDLWPSSCCDGSAFQKRDPGIIMGSTPVSLHGHRGHN